MKIIRKILVVILSIILTGMLIGMTVTFSLHKIISRNMVHDIVKEEFSSDTEFLESLSISQEKIEIALDNEEVVQFINKYVDNMIESVSNDKVLNELDMGTDLKKLIEANKTVLMDELNLNENEFNEVINSTDFEEINDTYQQSVTELRDSLGSEGKNVLKFYSFMGSNSYHLIVIISIIVLIILIAICEWSYINSLIPVGISSIVAGTISIGIAFLCQFIINLALEDEQFEFSIKMDPMFIYSISILVIGIIMVVGYNIYKKKKTNNEINTIF